MTEDDGGDVGAPLVNPEQLAAIGADGVVFVSAGAGTGKTTVLVERFVRAVVDRGLGIDSVLVITYTERAAGELRERIRRRLREGGRRDLARDLDRAWVSTIHGFCARLLRAHPFEAGLDPRFRVLDESQAAVLRAAAFQSALAELCSGREPERLRLLETYGARGLASMLTAVHGRLRSAGLPLELPLEGPDAAVAEPGPGEPNLEELATRDRALLEELLGLFDRAYRAAKDRESALDFEDLQLAARDLLRADGSVRERTRFRFRVLLVDEFQDTNRLQCELIDLAAGDDADLFFVGDEFQSIYRFRHADVDVFRERRARSAGVLALTRNYRSRPEVLAVVNHVFASGFGDGFEPLEAAGLFPDVAVEPAVELLVTDKAAFRGSGTHWRRAEALQVARRVRSLVDGGACEPGEIVLLFAAGTSAEQYEEALREQGLPTFRATGRGYFGQQQVVDLLAYLRLLQNRYDDEALVTVLASPLVGVSNDALALLRYASRGPLFTGLERQPPPGLAERDRRLVEAFRQRYDRLCALSASAGLEHLCERIVAEHDYDLAVLARWDGRRRYANLRKLARLARSYEELRGPDLEGFVRFVRDQETAGAREVEAVAEDEGAQAVRLLTIHAAKGLEFRVVVVCDAGRAGAPAAADEILCLPDGRLGFRVADPVSGKRVGVLGYDRVREVERAAQEQESRRLYYVAMTRAIDRLIVSGSLDPDRPGAERTPIGWVLERLGADTAADGPVELDCNGARVLLRVERALPPAPAPPEPALDQQLELFQPGQAPPAAPAFELPDLAPLPAPPARAVRRLSYSALALHARCPYRYYVERVAGVSEARETAEDPAEGLAATELGDAVHAALEAGAPPSQAPDLARALYPHATPADLERVRSLVDAWHGSALARRLAGFPQRGVERPFAFEHDGVLVHGRLDVIARHGPLTVVVDYKTHRLGEGTTPAEIVEADYRLQRVVYALAALRGGADEVEVAYVFLERPDDVVSAALGRGDVPVLETELGEAIDAIRSGRFEPTPGELACAGCPALDRICAGPRLAVRPGGSAGSSLAAAV